MGLRVSGSKGRGGKRGAVEMDKLRGGGIGLRLEVGEGFGERVEQNWTARSLKLESGAFTL